MYLFKKYSVYFYINFRNGDNISKCSKCNEIFSYSRLEKDKKVLAYQCECGELLHLDNNDLKKQYICKICDKTFDNQVDWKTHQKSHTQEDRWKCKYCFKGKF